jgi:hypothetical protein
MRRVAYRLRRRVRRAQWDIALLCAVLQLAAGGLMGTRADFYVGRGADAEWLGSIAWDGYPSGIDLAVLHAKTEGDFRSALTSFFESDRDDVTLPEMGWPWPWNTSNTTDYAYAFDGGTVWGCCFGGVWFEATDEPDDHEEWDRVGGLRAVFPDMAERKNVQIGGKRSGLIVVSAPPPKDAA